MGFKTLRRSKGTTRLRGNLASHTMEPLADPHQTEQSFPVSSSSSLNGPSNSLKGSSLETSNFVRSPTVFPDPYSNLILTKNSSQPSQRPLHEENSHQISSSQPDLCSNTSADPTIDMEKPVVEEISGIYLEDQGQEKIRREALEALTAIKVDYANLLER